MKKIYFIVVVLWSLCASAIFTGCAKEKEFVPSFEEPVTVDESEDVTKEDAPLEENSSKTIEEEKQTTKVVQPTQIFVHVCGAVKVPGVYQLYEGQRVYEAISMAGGVTEDASDVCINQAQILEDGQSIYICTVEEMDQQEIPGITETSIVAGEESADDGVNINTATREQLCTLPGVGASRADAIIAYREEHGAFQTIEDIMNVTGIKDGLFGNIKDKIKVS